MFNDDIVAKIGDFLCYKDRNALRLASKCFNASHWNNKYHEFKETSDIIKCYKSVKKLKPHLDIIMLSWCKYKTLKKLLSVASGHKIKAYLLVKNWSEAHLAVQTQLKSNIGIMLTIAVFDNIHTKHLKVKKTEWKFINLQIDPINAPINILKLLAPYLNMLELCFSQTQCILPKEFAELELPITLICKANKYYIDMDQEVKPYISAIFFDCQIDNNNFYMTSDFSKVKNLIFDKPVICGLNSQRMNSYVALISSSKCKVHLRNTALKEPASFHFFHKLCKLTKCEMNICCDGPEVELLAHLCSFHSKVTVYYKPYILKSNIDRLIESCILNT